MRQNLTRLAVLVVGLSTALHASVVTFDFLTDSVGLAGGVATIPFNDVAGGLTATFDSSGGASTFLQSTTPGTFLNMQNTLLDQAPGTNIVISFDPSVSVTAISLDFATMDPNLSNNIGALQLQASDGGSNSVIDAPDGNLAGLPEGLLSYTSATSFTSVTLTTAPPLVFGIGNITVTYSDTSSDPPAPEPGTLVFAGAALVALAWRVKARH